MDIKTSQHIRELADKWLAGTITLAEQQEFDSWYQQFNFSQLDYEGTEVQSPELIKARIHARLLRTLAKETPKSSRKIKLMTLTYGAATVLIVVLATIYLYPRLLFNHKKTTPNEIGPGSNKATLTLADGTKIKLQSDKAGIQINGKKIIYNDGTSIRAIHSSSNTLNSLTTPRGGQYKIILSDGTKVWLNSASKLVYPEHFEGNIRQVSIIGEAYFEVTRQAGKTFQVVSKGQLIAVMGTEFNISSYENDEEIKTTLVSGSIEVSIPNSICKERLLPEQETILTGNTLKKHKADIASAIAWHQGLFQFNEEPLGSIMKKLSRWYDVEVHFEDDTLRNKSFYGVVNRYKQISAVLEILEDVGDVKFEVTGRRVNVLNKSK
ncbi:FecR family protein [bacterium A37T11]|nr:FecR family protein [bacterium A37T11]